MNFNFVHAVKKNQKFGKFSVEKSEFSFQIKSECLKTVKNVKFVKQNNLAPI